MRAAGRGGATLVLQMCVDIGPRGFQSRSKATEQRASHRDNDGEEQDVRIEADRDGGNRGVESQTSADKINAPIGKHETNATTEKSDEQVFSQQLPNNAKASGP